MPKSPSARLNSQIIFLPVCFLLFAAAQPLSGSNPWSVVWTAPCILLASIVITWGAESAQYFIAQGFALAILAWMQTLPEFAVEAVLAWKQQTVLLIANLTGAVRLLTGLAWPFIFFTAAVVHRKSTGRWLREIELDRHHSVEVVGLILPLLYAVFIWWKSSLHLYDGIVLFLLYFAYLAVLLRLPAQGHEGVGELPAVPRSIVRASRLPRTAAICACFAVGGILIYFTAEPFLGSLIALATAVGIPSFIVIQWLAPVISEFPELLSTFYFARQEEKAPVALMNIASSNINQWTLLFGMLPMVFSMSRGTVSSIPLDSEQQTELLLTIAQSAVSLMFLVNMRFSAMEAAGMFLFFTLQFVAPHFFGEVSKNWIAYAFLGWSMVEMLRILARRRLPCAIEEFAYTWRAHIGRR